MRVPPTLSSQFLRLTTSFSLSARTPVIFPLRHVKHQKQHSRTIRTMDAQELAQYYADAPPAVVKLEVAKHFQPLSEKQKRYAHFISK